MTDNEWRDIVSTGTDSKEIFGALGFETRITKYAGTCESCGKRHESGKARIARCRNYGRYTQWSVLCRSLTCTKAYLTTTRGGVSDSGDTMGLEGR